MPSSSRTWYSFREKRAASVSINMCLPLISLQQIHLPFFLPSFFWICHKRIHARNKPVKYRNVYKPTTIWNQSVRLSSKNSVSVVLNIRREDLLSAQDLRKKKKKT